VKRILGTAEDYRRLYGGGDLKPRVAPRSTAKPGAAKSSTAKPKAPAKKRSAKKPIRRSPG
jgi:hypothetical protein